MANKKVIKPHKVTKDYLFQNIDNGVDTDIDSHNIGLEENKRKFAQKYENKREELIRIINNSLVENISNDDLKFTFQNNNQDKDHLIEGHNANQNSYHEYANSLYQYYGFFRIFIFSFFLVFIFCILIASIISMLKILINKLRKRKKTHKDSKCEITLMNEII
ncbi:conserved Plasmodium protein, unknown function [Plasmodium vinckei vinckei]|uniref:Uncharacterized protein n=1 Tax=Plasmodium vinckei vinckei TaxID=54757 RepID=A0A449BUN7_PLAVN|nr:conserved Plasmodium protein, unknown function [Plasmodium vinckei vinckei]VEV57049.1 conserved Plasmodium protein, unknown function [Plasmodium vinckei vinckei]